MSSVTISSLLQGKKAVLFDLAGTLFDDRNLAPFLIENLQFVGRKVGLDEDDLSYKESYKKGVKKAFVDFFGRKFYLHDDFFTQCYRCTFELLDKNIDEEIIREAVKRQNDYTAANLILREDCIGTLRALKVLGLHVQVVSNFDEKPLVNALSRSGLIELLDGWTSSETAGSCKPNGGIFDKALAKVGCQPEEAIYVGDTPMHDILGANNAGMASVLLDPKERHQTISDDWMTPTMIITSLSELLPG